MEKSNLYTRTGDMGTTSLVGGERVNKDSLRLEAYGTIDEFSAHLGMLTARKDTPQNIRNQILKIQNMMFCLGAYLATQPQPGTQPEVNNLTTEDVKELEGWIDRLDAETPKIRAFVLPGGTETAVFAHIARTVCRRAERAILRLSHQEYISPTLLGYINRLSDYLFILSRYINHKSGQTEVIWNPVK
ncbi:MAG: cob(I)yrinic acid a,c-diamide adenosyltransferase [Prevotella sp.]|nr:cob(I)yrinic acid a,c-diamide adenosyltransferase [Bacteroides sp.]MCM1367103.1 cob(I)yrinic acid a,c-diamide adenosyltransferase [Prevotella sp.]MCM1437368.1 cob(I)yrinic acid a,c-diamide adenosyltransferase [Prevotella sp.]